MVIGIGIKILQTAFRYRNQIYKVLSAQDRAIGTAARIGGYGRQAQRGVRHGAIAGSVIGTVLSEFGDDIEDFGQTKQPVSTSRKYTKTRRRYPSRFNIRCPTDIRPRRRRRRSHYY